MTQDNHIIQSIEELEALAVELVVLEVADVQPAAGEVSARYAVLGAAAVVLGVEELALVDELAVLHLFCS